MAGYPVHPNYPYYQQDYQAAYAAGGYAPPAGSYPPAAGAWPQAAGYPPAAGGYPGAYGAAPGAYGPPPGGYPAPGAPPAADYSQAGASPAAYGGYPGYYPAGAPAAGYGGAPPPATAAAGAAPPAAAPGYGAAPPGAPAPGYGAPPAGYGAPPPGYGAAPGYGAPPAGPPAEGPPYHFPMLFKADVVKEGNPITTFLGEWCYFEAQNPTAFGFAGAREYYSEIQFFDQTSLMVTHTWSAPPGFSVIGFDVLEASKKIVTYMHPKDERSGQKDVIRVYDMYGSAEPNELISNTQNGDIRCQVKAFPTHSTPCVALTDKNDNNVAQFYDLNTGRPFRSYKNPSRHSDWFICNVEVDPANREAFWLNLYRRIVQYDLRCPDDRASVTLEGVGSDVTGIRSYGISVSENYVAAASRYLPTVVYDVRNPSTPLYKTEDRCLSVCVHGNAFLVNFDEKVQLYDLSRAISPDKPEKLITNSRRSFGAFFLRNGRRFISLPSLDVISLDGPVPKGASSAPAYGAYGGYTAPAASSKKSGKKKK